MDLDPQHCLNAGGKCCRDRSSHHLGLTFILIILLSNRLPRANFSLLADSVSVSHADPNPI